VKFSLFLIRHHNTNMYVGVEVQLHATPALTPGKEPPVSIEQEAGWTPEPV